MSSNVLGSTAWNHREIPPKLEFIEEFMEDEILVIRRRGMRDGEARRVIFINNYGQAKAWRLWKEGAYPGNHLWGCIELAIKGYEVLIPEPASGHGFRKRLKFDWQPTLGAVRRMRPDDIVYCAHNVLLWTPLLKALSLAKCRMVGLLYAREPLPFGNRYDAIIAGTPDAFERATLKYPRVRTDYISWGMDTDFFKAYPYDPQWILSCGKTFRDFDVVAKGLANCDTPLRILHPHPSSLPHMPACARVESAADVGEEIYIPLVHEYYRHAIATLLTIIPEPTNRHSVGLTNVLESMACARPVIATRTSAMAREIDVTSLEVGLFIDPASPHQVRAGVERLHANREEAQVLGLNGRRLCENHFNIDRYATDLHRLFERL